MSDFYTIGIDPDSKKHGVAFYDEGKLSYLWMMGTVELITKIILPDRLNIKVVSIEDVSANNFVYRQKQTQYRNVQADIARKVGRCQQAQLELMRWLDYYEVPYVLHKPQKGNWAKQKALFEKITGWTKQSNEDTRSAAYFGYLEASR